MEQIWDRYSKTISNIFVIALLLGIIYSFFTFIIPFFLPFFVGILIATVNAPFVRLFEKNLKLKRSYAVLVSMFLTISFIAIILIFSALNIYNELIKLQSNISTYFNSTYSNIQGYYESMMNYYKNLPPDITETINTNLNALKLKSEGLLGSVIATMLSTVQSIPKILIFVVISLLSAYFISSDNRRIRVFITKQLPRPLEKRWDGFRSDAITAFLGYIKAVLILMAITFVEVTIGLLILDADYAILMGVIVGISEAIPIFGTGMVMVPWILWHVIMGNSHMAIGLTVIFVLGVILRHAIEPKIIGETMGLHPLATLLAMYIGLEIFGFLGLFVGPFSLIVLKSMQKAGVVRIWRE